MEYEADLYVNMNYYKTMCLNSNANVGNDVIYEYVNKNDPKDMWKTEYLNQPIDYCKEMEYDIRPKIEQLEFKWFAPHKLNAENPNVKIDKYHKLVWTNKNQNINNYDDYDYQINKKYNKIESRFNILDL